MLVCVGALPGTSDTGLPRTCVIQWGQMHFLTVKIKRNDQYVNR